MLEAPKTSDNSLVYMYGLSDFWVDMFGDKKLTETLLEGETVQLAEAYSYFLQRAAGISLTDIQDKYQTRIKLILLGEEDLVDSSDTTSFKLDSSLLSIKKLSNRPILPTQTLSYGIHFDIKDNILKLYKPLSELKFPVRYNSDGTWQYAIWMCDVEIDDKWIDNTFGRLVGFTKDDAIFNYKSFLEGVYFLYTNGPNVSNIIRGVNLAMGMPYARDTEKVLDIAQDETSSNWVVFTETFAYEIPYSYNPNISVGDILVEGEVLSTWVEVVDYSSAGAWWYQVYIPQELLGEGTDTYELGLATKGSTADTMMNNFLKHHMFEVLITQPSSDVTAYNTARSLVLRAKPEYTYPVFVWAASIGDEDIHLEDDLYYDYLARLDDYCISPPSIRFMDRSTNDTIFSRGTHWYNRVQGSIYATTLLGYGDWKGNAGWAPQFDSIEDRYSEYLSVTIRNRGDTISPTNRGTITRGVRGISYPSYTGITWEVPSASVYGGTGPVVVEERHLTPLYMMSRSELISKMTTLDSRFSINGRTKFVVSGLDMVAKYSTWMKRNSSIDTNDTDNFSFEYSDGDLDIMLSPYAYQTYVPSLSDMYDTSGSPIMDGSLFITRTTDNSWVCQWIRTRVAVAPTLFPVEDADLTLATEEYRFDDNVVEYMGNNSVSFNSDVVRIQTPRVVSGVQDLLVTIDGLYIPTYEYSIEYENSRAEIPQYDPEDPSSIDLGVLSRTYVVLQNSADAMGYIAYDNYLNTSTIEEYLEPGEDGKYTLTELVPREGLLVIHNGGFTFDYSIEEYVLSLGFDTTGITIRYVNHRDEEILPSGSSSYTLSEDSRCKIFIGPRLLEEWAFVRSGTSITLPFVTEQDVVVRYYDIEDYIKHAVFTRSTVESNKARFLMDRSRENGEYDDHLGHTVFMNRSGTPTVSEGVNTDTVNVTRRLR